LITTDALAAVAALALAMPKSLTFTAPFQPTSTLCGETSRWIKPRTPSAPAGRSCAYPSPRSTSTDHVDRHGPREPTGLEEPVEVATFDQLHHEVQPAVVAAIEVEHADDVRVLHPRGQLRLAMNMVLNAGCLLASGRTRLIATGRSKPSAPTVCARKTSAMPPAPRRASRTYLPRRTGAAACVEAPGFPICVDTSGHDTPVGDETEGRRGSGPTDPLD
jgi:hypothetical protein